MQWLPFRLSLQGLSLIHIFAPLLGLSDGIVDIVETGATLRENGLEVAEDLISLSARLIVNNASLKLRKKELESIISAIQNAVKA